MVEMNDNVAARVRFGSPNISNIEYSVALTVEMDYIFGGMSCSYKIEQEYNESFLGIL